MSGPDHELAMWALDTLCRYAPAPLVDDYREEAPVEPSDAEQFFAEQQCPADSNFR